jgi:hypothetical protein
MRSAARLLPLLALAGMLFAGCGSPTPAGTSTASPAPASSSAAPSGSPGPTPSPSGSAADDGNAPAGQCPNSSLAITVEPGDAGAGSLFYNIVFRNTGTGQCALRGYPGVSVVGNGNGTQLGQPADRVPGAAVETLQLGPGATVVAPLQAVNIGSDGGPLGDQCPTTTGNGWRIYPPHSFDAVFVQAEGIPACTGATPWLTVGPVRAG